MKGYLFALDEQKGIHVQKAFLSENFHLELILPPFRFQQYYDPIYHIFLFFLPIHHHPEILDFIHFLHTDRKHVVTAGLFEHHSPPLNDFDFVFLKPFSYRFITFQVQQRFFDKQRNFSENRIDVGKTTLDFLAREVCKFPYRVSLRSKEFSLLQLLMMNPGRIFSRTDILELVWDCFSPFDTNTIEVHISRLRKKLKQCRSPLSIKTLPSVGYFLSDNMSN